MNVIIVSLSGIDLDYSADEVVYHDHTKKHGVLASACFMLKRCAAVPTIKAVR